MRARNDVVAILRERIVSGVHFGRIVHGDRLTSARRVAHELDVDARVVANAYEQLRREGMVARQEGSRGYFAAVGSGLNGETGSGTEWLVEILAQALARGVPTAQFVEHARRSLESVRLRVACIECNLDQLRWLGCELERDYGFLTHPVEMGGLEAAADTPSALSDVDLIVTTSAHAAEVRPAATMLGKPLVLVTLRPDILSAVARLLAAGPVYFLCTDPRFATKLRHLYKGVPNAANVRPVVLGIDDPAEIPAGAPAWAMQTAIERLGGVPSQVRALPTTRIFSPDTTRELLSYVVHTNLAAAGEAQSPRDFLGVV